MIETARSVIRGDTDIWLEASGGIDSTLMGSIAKIVKPNITINTISLLYPYYEFRREKRFIDSAINFLGGNPLYLDGSKSLSFDSIGSSYLFSEPNLLMAGIAQQKMILESVSMKNGLLLNGNGGDRLFSLGPFFEQGVVLKEYKHKWMDDFFFERLQFSRNEIRKFNKFSSGENFISGVSIDDRWTEREFAPYFDVRRTHFFLDNEVTSIIHALWSVEKEAGDGKWILKKYLPELFPYDIISRPKKVAYNALYVRSYKKNLNKILALIDEFNEELRGYGVNPKLLSEHVVNISNGKLDGDLEVSSVITFLMWLKPLLARNIIAN